MRRLLAILLLAAFGLPAVAPVLAQAQDAQSNLPACCRRNGAHHCSMGVSARAGNAPVFGALCPSFPRPTALTPQQTLSALALLPALGHAAQAALSSSALPASQDSSPAERGHPKRGPPPQISAA